MRPKGTDSGGPSMCAAELRCLPADPVRSMLSWLFRTSAFPERGFPSSSSAPAATLAASDSSLWRVLCACTRSAYAPSFAISWAWVPLSTTCPPSNTWMVSASWMVESLWAMTRTVRPFMRTSRAAWTTRSLSLSSADVASSRRRILGFLTNALAMAMRCFWPPLS
mmetsp:Transcript_5911/g.10139  ORF Transcript_5911/g.10139 Transcript_5911/m.10139 type:complete len:166 (-) Transcript_5911:332-829(-)